MMYTAKKFDLPELAGLSKKQIEVHLALYEGYVKHVNLIREKLRELKESTGDNTYLMSELRRRFAFEFDGMRLHEYYFEQFEGGPVGGNENSPLEMAAKEKYGGLEGLVAHIKEVAGSRGIGWVVVYLDPIGSVLHTVFVNDHEVGQLAGLPVILALDVWEHAFMVDYVPADKKKYIEAFFVNLNWGVCEKRLEAAARG